jgi:hypothetical protein
MTRVFRSKIGSWLALFALAIQFVVSFAHGHYPALGACPSSARSTAASGLTCNGPLDWARSVLPSGSLSDAPISPAKPTGLPVERCVVCALATAAVPTPAAPELSLPVAFDWARFEAAVERPLSAVPFGLFQARAPPQA